MKIVKILKTQTLPKEIDTTWMHLQERHNAYVLRQITAPFKNPICEKVSFFKDMLTLIGVIPIKRPTNIQQKRIYF